jgi:hypothetical protein
MSRRTFKCNNIQQNVMSQTRNLKNPIKPPQKNNITERNPPGWIKKKTRVFPNPGCPGWLKKETKISSEPYGSFLHV